jgi:hypothetical protein
MKTTILKAVTCTLALLFALPFAMTHAQSANSVFVQEAQQIAEDAYIYGYPLITMEMTRCVMTNVREADGKRAPMGHLLKYRAYPTAWVNVGKEPWVLSLPDANDRYYLLLATSTRGSIHPHAPPLLADGKIAVHPQRHLEDSGCAEGEVIAS